MNTARKLALLLGRMARMSVGNPQRLSHVLGTALAASEEVADVSTDLLRFPQETVDDLLPEAGKSWRVTLELMPRSAASISLLECLCLVMLMKRARATFVFEFGTYKGVSITQLALNLPEAARIYTLDLPDGQLDSELPISIPKDSRIAFEPGKGALVPPDVRGRIQFLKQDSAKFDPLPYEGQIGFVFVDGAHNTEYVRNDSEKGWRMLQPGGIIAWHDCVPNDPEVVRFLLASDYKPARIRGTSLAYAVKR